MNNEHNYERRKLINIGCFDIARIFHQYQTYEYDIVVYDYI